MRIGIDARMYGPESTTGIGVYIQKLTEQLFNIDNDNEYFLFLKEPVFSRFDPPNDRVKKIKADYPWYSLAEQIVWPAVLSKYRLDLVHFPHFNVPLLYRKKYVITIHDITPKLFPGPKVKKLPWRKLAYDLVFKNALKTSKKIITISNYTKNNLIKEFRVDENKIEVIYPGCDPEFRAIIDQQVIADLRNKYGITKPFFFYVGVWRDHKNLPGLISAFEIIKSKYNLDYQLVLGGNPDPRYPEITEAIKKSPFKNDIITPGFIPKLELPVFYSAAKLFILPSFAEGFGLVAVESLSCGTPVVGSKTTSLPEILDGAALYFNPHDPSDIALTINRAITDKATYQQITEKGKAIAHNYSWEKCAKNTLKIYQTI